MVLDTLNISSLQNSILNFNEELNEDNEMDSPGMANDRAIDDSVYTDEEPPTKRFMKIKKSTRPLNPVLLEIQKQYAQDIEIQKEFMNISQAMISEQKEQTKLLFQLITFMMNK